MARASWTTSWRSPWTLVSSGLLRPGTTRRSTGPGTFSDSNSNGFTSSHSLPSSTRGTRLPGDSSGCSFRETPWPRLRWDDPWGASCRDYDLYLKRTDDNTGQAITVASSENVQNDGVSCTPDANPVEVFQHEVTVLDVYHLVIEEKHSSSDAFLDLFSGYMDIEYQVAANSLFNPATARR